MHEFAIERTGQEELEFQDSLDYIDKLINE